MVFNLVFIGIFIFFAIRPTISTILVLQKTIEDNQQTLNALNQKAQDLSEGKKNLDAIPSEKRDKINQALPNQASVPVLINNIQTSFVSEASLSGLQVQPVTIFDSSQNDQDLTTPGEVNFSLSLQGDYQALLTVLNNLNSSARILSLQAVTFTNQVKNSSLNLSVTGKAYFVKW